MFDNLKGLAGLAAILKDLPKIKAKLADVRSRLGETNVTGRSGDGAVVATASGLLRVVSVEVHEADPGSAGDLITEAVNNALGEARKLAEREMAQAADELGIPLPPGGLAGLIG